MGYVLKVEDGDLGRSKDFVAEVLREPLIRVFRSALQNQPS